MRPIACAFLLALSVLAGCGGSSPALAPNAQSPSPSPEPVWRAAKPGETIALQSGLTVTVPLGFRGSYVRGNQPDLVDALMADAVRTPSFSSIAAEHGGMFKWPLVTESADGTVEVRHVVSKGLAVTSVVVRLADHPTGLVVFAGRGARAVKAPRAVMAQVERVWRRFAVKGVSLPTLKQ